MGLGIEIREQFLDREGFGTFSLIGYQNSAEPEV